jgi:Cytochrome c.
MNQIHLPKSTLVFFTGAAMLLIAQIASPAYGADVKNGQHIFESNTCVDCHVGGGNSVKPSKPIKGDAFAKKYKDDVKLEKVIRQGIPGTTMLPTGKDVISDSNLKDLIAFIRSLTPGSESNKSEKKSSKKTGNSSH